MASFDEACKNTLKWEDPALSGQVTVDSGGKTRFGISAKSYPDVDIENLTLEGAEDIYHRDFWLPMFDDIQSQAVANKVFDMGVNMGVRVAVKLCQKALNDCGEVIVIDGRFGPTTLNAVNRQDERDLLPELRNAAVERYMQIIDDNPKLKRYERGWLKRARS